MRWVCHRVKCPFESTPRGLGYGTLASPASLLFSGRVLLPAMRLAGAQSSSQSEIARNG